MKLTELENTLEGAVNYNIARQNQGEDIIFLRKIVPGGADRSYGIGSQAGGAAEKVLQRARTVLRELEEENGVSYAPPRRGGQGLPERRGGGRGARTPAPVPDRRPESSGGTESSMSGSASCQ